MFVRLMFLLLLALNLGAGAWWWFGRAPARSFPAATDPGVAELRMWAEAPKKAPLPAAAAATAGSTQPPTVATAGSVPSAAATGASTRQPVAPAGSSTQPSVADTAGPAQPFIAASSASLPRDACTTLGPFMTAADMRSAMQSLSPHVARIQYREERVNRSHGYWVYLPQAATREAALEDARQLAAKGIHDYYVVTAGDTQNTISLGLFNDQANADRRRAMVQKAGFAAKVEQRIDTAAAYWLDYAVPQGEAFDWTAWLPDRNDLQAKSIDCF
jgi:hypothetical protein